MRTAELRAKYAGGHQFLALDREPQAAQRRLALNDSMAQEIGDLPRIRLLILDVDGVLTSGALPYGIDGNVEKAFYVQDGGAIRLWQRAGGAVAIISGRSSPVVERRACDVGVTEVHQGIHDKLSVYDAVRNRQGVTDDEVAFIGDDLVDLASMRRCGYPIAVANAVPCVKRAARYVTRRRGGEGAVNEAIRRLLRENGQWEELIAGWLH